MTFFNEEKSQIDPPAPVAPLSDGDVLFITNTHTQHSDWADFQRHGNTLLSSNEADRNTTTECEFQLEVFSKVEDDLVFQRRHSVVVKDVTTLEATVWSLFRDAPFGTLAAQVKGEHQPFFDFDVKRSMTDQKTSLKFSKVRDGKEELRSFAKQLRDCFTKKTMGDKKTMGATTQIDSQQMQSVCSEVEGLVKSLLSEHHGHQPNAVFVTDMLTDVDNLHHLHLPKGGAQLISIPLSQLSFMTKGGTLYDPGTPLMDMFQKEDLKDGKPRIVEVGGVFTNTLFLKVKMKLVIPDLEAMSAERSVQMSAVLGDGEMKLEDGKIRIHVPVFCKKQVKVR